jgi:hypothetical protein
MTGIAFTNASGEPDLLPVEEIVPVEQTGRSSWQEYASTPMEWPERISVKRVARLAIHRPGAVSHGQRPAHTESIPLNRHGLPHLGAYCYHYHFSKNRTCHVSRRPTLNANAILDEEKFQKAIRLGIACKHCTSDFKALTDAA